MTAKELKEILNDVPDEYVVGYTSEYTTIENWYGVQHRENFRKLAMEPTCNMKDKTLSLFKKLG